MTEYILSILQGVFMLSNFVWKPDEVRIYTTRDIWKFFQIVLACIKACAILGELNSNITLKKCTSSKSFLKLHLRLHLY